MSTATMSEASEAPANELVTFDSFGLYPDALCALTEGGYTKPTSTQAAAILVATAGHGVMGAAQTGIGRTAGFSLPVTCNLLPDANTGASPTRHPVQALILTPTCELADQVYNNVTRCAKYTALRGAVVLEGVDMNPRAGQLHRGVETLVIMSGRLPDHMQQRSMNLLQMRMLMLDETNHMFDTGFLLDLQRIISLLPARRQTLLSSATFSPRIKRLAASYPCHPQTIEVACSNATAENACQTTYVVSNNHKQIALMHPLCQHTEQDLPRQCTMFFNNKIDCLRLTRAPEREDINAGAIHDDETQTEHIQTLEAFKQGTADVLVITSVVARGPSISQMSYMINSDLPFNAEDHVHRISRTGRVDTSGDALSLFVPGDEHLLANIEKLIEHSLPRGQLTDFDPTGEQVRDRERRERDERRTRSEVRRSREREDRNGTCVLDHTVVCPAFHPSGDLFFNCLYESSAPVEPAEATRPVQTTGHPHIAKRLIVALLGGVSHKR